MHLRVIDRGCLALGGFFYYKIKSWGMRFKKSHTPTFVLEPLILTLIQEDIYYISSLHKIIYSLCQIDKFPFVEEMNHF